MPFWYIIHMYAHPVFLRPFFPFWSIVSGNNLATLAAKKLTSSFAHFSTKSWFRGAIDPTEWLGL
jgi:hypothetical protein